MILEGIYASMDAIPGIRQLREAALERANTLGFPTTNDEEYKYTSLRSVSETKWNQGGGIDQFDFASHPLFGFDQYRVVFVNGQYSAELSDHAGLSVELLSQSTKGQALVGTLARIDEAKFTVAAHLGRLSKPGADVFASSNTASFSEGLFLGLASNEKLDKPVHVVFISSGANSASFPRLVINAESGSEAELIETYLSADDDSHLTIPVTEIFVAPNAVIEHVRVCAESLKTTTLGLVEVKQESDSTYRSYNVVFGSAIARNVINIFIDGSNAHTRFDGVVALSGDQHVDNRTRLDHVKPHCESFEVYKHLLSDHSRAVFNGKIFVHQDAQKTDAKQTNKTLLLSPNAEIDTKPQLEIFADDVKCTHGATIGHLREDALFYLKSRGIGDAEARAILVYAFAAEVLELIECEGAKQALESMLFSKLNPGR